MPTLAVAIAGCCHGNSQHCSSGSSERARVKSTSQTRPDLLGDPVHVGDLLLVADDLDGRPHVLDHLGVRLPLLHHA